MAILSTNEHILAFGNGSSGPTYSAGDYIDITNDVISVTGLVPKDEYSAFSSHMTACCEEVSGKVDDNSAAITAINNHITNIDSSITTLSSNALSAVSHDTTLTGDGTEANPLKVTIPVVAVSTQEEATGTNVLYVVTGTI